LDGYERQQRVGQHHERRKRLILACLSASRGSGGFDGGARMNLRAPLHFQALKPMSKAMGEVGERAREMPVGRPPDARTGGWGGHLGGLWVAGLAVLYAFTLRPSIGWNDAPEFVDVAYTLGIAHPSGFPAYALLGKLATLLPLGGIALRVNLLSALCSLGALLLLVRCVADLHVRLGGSVSNGRIAGLLCGGLLAVAPTYWNYATQAEVYAPLTLVVALLLYLALRWDATGDERYLLGGALLFGLSGGIHGTAILFLPALAFFVLTGSPRKRRAGPILRALLFGLLGASVWLYLPLRAVAEPPINWGHPDTWGRFWVHVSDRKDAGLHFIGGSKPWWPFVREFARNLNAEVTPVGWLLALGGLAVTVRRSPRWAIFTLVFCLGNLLFFLRIWTIPDAYLPTFFFVVLWAGIGAAWLFDRSHAIAAPIPALVCLAVLLAIGIQVSEGSARVQAHAHDAARSNAEAHLLPLQQDALVFAMVQWFPMRYLQDVEGLRPDLDILLVSDLTVPSYFTPVTEKRFPRLGIPPKEGGDENWESYFASFLRENLPRVPVYWEPIASLNQHVYPYLQPWRYLWRFNPHGPVESTPEMVDAYFSDLRGFLTQEFDTPGVLQDPDAARYNAFLLTVSSEAMNYRGRPQDSLPLVELAARLEPKDATIVNALGRLFSGFGRWEEAERMFTQAALLSPGEPSAYLNLAVLQMSLERWDDAGEAIATAMSIDPAAPEPYYELSVLERQRENPAEARVALANAIARAQDENKILKWRAELDILGEVKAP
jgi:tetratricopeptide (TPR) repeat protein